MHWPVTHDNLFLEKTTIDRNGLEFVSIRTLEAGRSAEFLHWRRNESLLDLLQIPGIQKLELPFHRKILCVRLPSPLFDSTRDCIRYPCSEVNSQYLTSVLLRSMRNLRFCSSLEIMDKRGAIGCDTMATFAFSRPSLEAAIFFKTNFFRHVLWTFILHTS